MIILLGVLIIGIPLNKLQIFTKYHEKVKYF